MSGSTLLVSDVAPLQTHLLTEQLCPVSPCHPHQLVLSTRVKGDIWGDVVDLAIENRPGVLTGFVLSISSSQRSSNELTFLSSSIVTLRKPGPVPRKSLPEDVRRAQSKAE